MTKKYISKSCISFSVTLPNGTKKRVSFSPVTSRGSVYYASEPDVQTGLERHPFFGKLFRLDESEERMRIAEEKAKAESKAKEEKKIEPIRIKYENLPDAKEYLARNFSGVSRTKLRTKEDIKKCAAEHNVVFDGIDG